MNETQTQMPTTEQRRETARALLAQVPSDEIEQALQELSRELQLRERCFPRWVAEGRISKLDAKERLHRQHLAVDILTILLDVYSEPE